MLSLENAHSKGQRTKNPLDEAPVICCCCWWVFQIQFCPANASPSPGSAPQTLPSHFSGSAAPNKGPKAATWKNNQAVLLNHQSAHPKENRPWKEFPFSLSPLFHFSTGRACCLSQSSDAVAAFAQAWQAPGRDEQPQGQELSLPTPWAPL